MPIFPGSSIPSADTGYTIDQSMYFGDAPSTGPKMSRQFDEAGSANPKWTFATWIKKGGPDTGAKTLYYFRPLAISAGADFEFVINNDSYPDVGNGPLRCNSWAAGSGDPTWDWTTGYNRLSLLDFSNFYHICHVIDYTTSPYVFIYVNGVLMDPDTIYATKTGAGYGTDFSPQSGDTFFIGSNYSNQCGNGYFADTYWIEQQALNPVGTFGEFSEDTGQFVPIEYTGTYSGNSFYLDYSDSSDFGADRSGLSNDFTVASIPATQQMLDTPTNTFANWNPLWGRTGTMPALTDGSRGGVSPAARQCPITATIAGLVSGKWYWEYDVVGLGGVDMDIGVLNTSGQMADISTGNGHTYRWYISSSGNKQSDTSGSTVAYGDSFAAADIVGVALDMDNGAIYFSKNGTWQDSGDPTSGASKTGAAYTDLLSAVPSTGWAPFMISNNASCKATVNFGPDSSFAGSKTAQGNQDSNGKGDFYYAPPTDYLALCTNNLADPAVELPTEHFNPKIFTGTGSELAITGVGFQPDFTWIKTRELAYNHRCFDAVRGVTKELYPNDIDVEVTDAQSLKTFDSDGFTLGTSSGVNPSSSSDMVSWNWKAGGTPTATNSAGAGATPTAGSVKIDGSDLGSALAGTIPVLKLSANTTNGFAIGAYTGNGSRDQTLAHGLSKGPELVIIKGYDGLTFNWTVGATAMGNWTDYMHLDGSAAAVDDVDFWEDTPPSSSVITIGPNGNMSYSGDTFIFYAWHSVEGYSKFGNYVGNGEDGDGNFIYLGFKPALVIFKKVSGVSGWAMYDNKRGGWAPMNVKKNRINANTLDAETDTYTDINMLSNGIKLLSNDGAFNDSGATYMYMAWSESSIKYATAR